MEQMMVSPKTKKKRSARVGSSRDGCSGRTANGRSRCLRCRRALGLERRKLGLQLEHLLLVLGLRGLQPKERGGGRGGWRGGAGWGARGGARRRGRESEHEHESESERANQKKELASPKYKIFSQMTSHRANRANRAIIPTAKSGSFDRPHLQLLDECALRLFIGLSVRETAFNTLLLHSVIPTKVFSTNQGLKIAPD